MRAVAALAVAVLLAAPALARAQRFAFDPPGSERTFARDGGPVVVHYTLQGMNAVLAEDLDGSGVPDFVEEVADVGDDVLTRLAEDHGFRSVLSDAGNDDDGGDQRFDIYLADFVRGADGLYDNEECSDQPFVCNGYVLMENDFVNFTYPSIELAIRVLVSHEIFHAVQAAYDNDQPNVWHEGSATWAEELLYPEQSDFERLVAGFLARPFRPFERSIGGFGESYPYGGAMWPYFLQHRYSGDIVAAIWERCEDTGADPDFLDAAEAELLGRGTTLAAAWIEFTRWNAETGSQAAPGRYPDAGRLPLALRETALAAPATATVVIEGMSARYQPLTGLGAGQRIVVDSVEPVAVVVRAPDGAVTRSDGGSDDALAVHHRFEVVAVDAAAAVEVVVTGVRRLAPPADVVIQVEADPPPPGADAGPAAMADAGTAADGDGDGGCCSAGAGQPPTLLVLLLIGAYLRRRWPRLQ